MSSTNFDDVLELVSLLRQRALQFLQPGKEATVDLHGNGNVHSCGEGVVGALASIDVVVGVDGSL